MDIKFDAYAAINDVVKGIEGLDGIQTIDATNIVDVGKTYDQFKNLTVDGPIVRGMLDRIGQTKFYTREYNPNMPDIMIDGFEWGSIIQSIETGESVVAEKDEAYSLEDGQSVDHYIVSLQPIINNLYNEKTPWRLRVTKFTKQIKNMFNSAEEFERFWAMIFTEVRNVFNCEINGMTHLALSNMIAETVKAGTNNQKVNLGKLYNTLNPSATVTNDDFMTNTDFLKFAIKEMSKIGKLMEDRTRLFNVNKLPRFTPGTEIKKFMHNDFAQACEFYLYSDTYHDEYVKADNAQILTYWQGIDKGTDFASTSKIDVNVASDNSHVAVKNVIGVIADKYAVALYNKEEEVAVTPLNASGLYWNTFYHYSTRYINDLRKNFVVFYVDTEEA